MFNLARMAVIASLWMLSLTLLIVRTIMREWEGLGVLSIWAIWIGLVALVATGWHLLVLERHRTIAIAEAAAVLALEQQTLKPVR